MQAAKVIDLPRGLRTETPEAIALTELSVTTYDDVFSNAKCRDGLLS